MDPVNKGTWWVMVPLPAMLMSIVSLCSSVLALAGGPRAISWVYWQDVEHSGIHGRL